jgi:hypothetical protein
MNQIHKDIKFNPPQEDNEQINFLDLLLIRKTFKIETDIFRKPTNTDTTISFFSNHPIEYKIAPYRYYFTRMHSLPLTPEKKQKEPTVLQYFAQSNNFPLAIIQKLNSHLQHKYNYERNNNTVRDRKPGQHSLIRAHKFTRLLIYLNTQM